MVGRYIFYNGSVFDGNDPTANSLDDSAIATDKQPLLAGGLGQFVNIIGTAAGITGIMVDISGLPMTLATSDFTFSVGNSATPDQWVAAPAPSGMLVRPGAGAGGSTRVEFTWAAGSIKNEWLQATVLANANTGLASADVFYYGSLVGFATGAATGGGNYAVTSQDLQLAAGDLHGFLNPAGVTNPHDYNRDGRVDATDQLIARYSAAGGNSLYPLDLSGNAWSGPLVITSGGTYGGNWQSLNPDVPAVLIHTTDPVVITNSGVRGMGHLITADVNGVNLTVTNTTGYGLNPNVLGRSPGRFVDVHQFTNIDIERDTLIGTAGIYLDTYLRTATPGSHTIRIFRNSALNIDGRHSNADGSFLTGPDDNNYVQFAQIANAHHLAGVQIAWNQVINLPGQSRVEDNISIFKSSGTSYNPILIHDNYIQGAYAATPASDANYTGGGIMLSDGTGPTADADSGYVQAYNNYVVSTSNYGIAISSGHDDSIFGNTVVASGLLPDGSGIAAQNVGIYIWNSRNDPFFANDTALYNTVGWVGPTARRNDYWLPNASAQTGNASAANPITLQTEQGLFNQWLAKLAAAQVTVGAPPR